jgi:hypothetical protein
VPAGRVLAQVGVIVLSVHFLAVCRPEAFGYQGLANASSASDSLHRETLLRAALLSATAIFCMESTMTP